MGWLQRHLEFFVKPYLGVVPSIGVSEFSSEDMTLIKNAWRSVKSQASGRPILLAGRDVFIFEVLARREGYPTLFLPQCSRVTARVVKIPNKKQYLLFDTGFMGSIPRALEISSYKMISSALNQEATQVFPKRKGSRNLALRIEKTPKYWKTGRLENGQIVQELSSKDEFRQAAELTIAVYKDSSPKHVPLRTLPERRFPKWW